MRRHALEDAGVTIAAGTDAGNIGTITARRCSVSSS